MDLCAFSVSLLGGAVGSHLFARGRGLGLCLLELLSLLLLEGRLVKLLVLGRNLSTHWVFIGYGQTHARAGSNRTAFRRMRWFYKPHREHEKQKSMQHGGAFAVILDRKRETQGVPTCAVPSPTFCFRAWNCLPSRAPHELNLSPKGSSSSSPRPSSLLANKG